MGRENGFYLRSTARWIAVLLLGGMIGFSAGGCAHNKEQDRRKAEATRNL
ncbi:MAG: hypothetical protein JRK53_11440, partial [Deltaproteobacteria bacterium]|nr:hypothetical protein [Deltaproteobacteria bacterium]